MKKILLGFGKTPDIPVSYEFVDISITPNWESLIPSEGFVYVLKSAYIYAIGSVPRKRIRLVTQEDLVKEPEEIAIQGKNSPCASSREKKVEVLQEESKPAAAVVEEILVSAKYHPREVNSKVWLSPYHVELIKKVLGTGCKIELLDERNVLLKTLGGNID